MKQGWISGIVALMPSVLGNAIEQCPGYKASNVQKSTGKLTADLRLAGEACNTYGYDLRDLKLLVEYQSGKSRTELYRLGNTDAE